ncbi:hypothetical protein BAE44_0001607 [Dichanthelium oligosanthes]|uniref:Ubiquitin-like domain-containing protein n=1 Tax=Dichanthelium oligosanthes TaxID=888268 RepID=A0A1E5WIZ4_9POAL|nr:hypothetical protein BAE44_0001607 [Dichanthelium oligosanthes]
MDVSFVCSGEEPFEMEVGFFDTVRDIKEKLQSRRGWPAAAMSLLHNGDVLADDVDDGDGIERHGIVEGSVIHVALALDGPREPRQVKRNRPASKRRGEEGAPPPPLRVTVVSRCGAGRVEVAVAARAAVSALRAELERARGAGFPLPGGGAYFFIHRQSVMDEARSFEWHGVATGDEIVVFDGSVTRASSY